MCIAFKESVYHIDDLIGCGFNSQIFVFSGAWSKSTLTTIWISSQLISKDPLNVTEVVTPSCLIVEKNLPRFGDIAWAKRIAVVKLDVCIWIWLDSLHGMVKLVQSVITGR